MLEAGTMAPGIELPDQNGTIHTQEGYNEISKRFTAIIRDN